MPTVQPVHVPKRHRRRLRTRIILSVLAIGTLLSFLFAVFALTLRRNLEERLIDRILAKEVAAFAEKIVREPNNPFIEYSLISGRQYSDAKLKNAPAAWQNLAPGVHRLVEETPTGRVAYKLAVHHVPGFWFFLKYDVTAEERTRRVVTVSITVSVAAFSLLALLLGFWSSGRIMSPVADLLKRLTRLGKRGKLEPLAPHFADDEVGMLAQALDDYSARLTELVERDREFNSDVSHELRTPLAVIQSTTELLSSMSGIPEKAQARLQRIDRAAKQSTELITALLHLSRGEKQAPNDGESTSVTQVVQSVVDNNRHHLIGRPVSVSVESLHPLMVPAPESVLSVVLGNLIGNAFKYTREGTVQIRIGEHAVSVADSGPGIPEEERDKVFDRHFRGQSGAATGSGSGAGLGLAIARRLCTLYGWQVRLEPREPHGILAKLTFVPDATQRKRE